NPYPSYETRKITLRTLTLQTLTLRTLTGPLGEDPERAGPSHDPPRCISGLATLRMQSILRMRSRTRNG
ncbi:MAG: hypothetical protein QME51_10000, partial [Planctomycetota bacterium]|nr:hypothetical protein [Planctomycetota bacterium]